MRTLRLSLVGMVTLVLLGGLGMLGVAQEEDGRWAAIVYSRTLLAPPDGFDSQGTVSHTPRGVRQLRGLEATSVQEHADPRLSGTWTLVYNEDDYPAWMGPKWGHYTRPLSVVERIAPAPR